MSDENCLFCKFVTGQLPVNVVSQNSGAIAFNDINPQAPIHILVIPKIHVKNLAELSNHPNELQSVMQLVSDLAVTQNLGQGYRVVFNTGQAAGQSVFHAHAHLLGGRSLQWPPG
jgi:histidine triad (HIT) family protein